jgi:adenylate kinase family enzyme
MKDFIFIAGAPGSGKSSVAKTLQEKLDCPLFEFGWIPEFRNTGTKVISYTEEESLAFENLVLVAKNYAKHGFKNVVITDLNNDYIERLPKIFNDYDFAIYTLRVRDEETLKQRVLDGSRTSEYRDWEKALEINNTLQNRSAFQNEVFIDVDGQSVDDIADRIMVKLEKASF